VPEPHPPKPNAPPSPEGRHEGPGQRTRGRTLQALLALFVLPNATLALLGAFVFLNRPLVNVDYLLLGWAQPVVGGAATAILFGLLFSVDFVQSVAPGYHFGARGLLEAATDVFSLEPVHVLGTGALVLGSVAVVAFAAFRLLPREGPGRRGLAVLGALAVLVTAADGLLSWNRIFPNERPVLSVNIATSTVFLTGSALLRTRAGPEVGPWDEEPATAPLWARLEEGSPLPPRIVLTVVESLGSFRDSTLQARQLGSLLRPSLRERYRIRTGSVRFQGSTVPGELRELCRLVAGSVRPEEEPLEDAACLPARLRAQGYRTLAAHGFRSSVFDRTRWYPSLGFDRVYFARELGDAIGAERRCGLTFRGLCDADVAAWLHRRLAEEEAPLFAYWLTLNAHLPLQEPDDGGASRGCGHPPVLTERPELCRLVRHHEIVFDALAAMAQDPELAPTAFLVVGDHAPAFLDRSLRDRFDSERVPYVILWPRGQ